MQVRFLGQEDPLEESMVNHSSILAWRILWTEEPRELKSMGSQRVRYDKQLSSSTYCFAIKWKLILKNNKSMFFIE